MVSKGSGNLIIFSTQYDSWIITETYARNLLHYEAKNKIQVFDRAQFRFRFRNPVVLPGRADMPIIMKLLAVATVDNSCISEGLACQESAFINNSFVACGCQLNKTKIHARTTNWQIQPTKALLHTAKHITMECGNMAHDILKHDLSISKLFPTETKIFADWMMSCWQ